MDPIETRVARVYGIMLQQLKEDVAREGYYNLKSTLLSGLVDLFQAEGLDIPMPPKEEPESLSEFVARSQRAYQIYFSPPVWEGGSLAGRDLSNMDLSYTTFHKIDMAGVNLSGCNLTNTIFKETDLAGANLSGANLTNTMFMKANLTSAHFAGCNLNYVMFSTPFLAKANFRGVDFSSFLGFSKGTDLTEAIFEKATLQKTCLSGVNATGADFRGADVTEAQFQNASLRGAKFQNAKATLTNFESADITGVSFEGADVQGAWFHRSCGRLL